MLCPCYETSNETDIEWGDARTRECHTVGCSVTAVKVLTREKLTLTLTYCLNLLLTVDFPAFISDGCVVLFSIVRILSINLLHLIVGLTFSFVS